MLRVLLTILSLLNALVGAALAAYAMRVQEIDPLMVGLALFLQGTYTLVYPKVLQPRSNHLFRMLFVGGHGAAGLVGGLDFLSGVLYNLHPRNGDVELVPVAMGFFMFILAATALLYDSRTGAPLVKAA
jgi:hypothetical protein